LCFNDDSSHGGLHQYLFDCAFPHATSKGRIQPEVAASPRSLPRNGARLFFSPAAKWRHSPRGKKGRLPPSSAVCGPNGCGRRFLGPRNAIGLDGRGRNRTETTMATSAPSLRRQRLQTGVGSRPLTLNVNATFVATRETTRRLDYRSLAGATVSAPPGGRPRGKPREFSRSARRS